MSYTTMTQSVRDQALQARVQAAAMKESIAGDSAFTESPTAAALRADPELYFDLFMWPTAVDYEVPYAYAVDQGNVNPGGDPGVITDANIQASIQTHWPVS